MPDFNKHCGTRTLFENKEHVHFVLRSNTCDIPELYRIRDGQTDTFMVHYKHT